VFRKILTWAFSFLEIDLQGSGYKEVDLHTVARCPILPQL